MKECSTVPSNVNFPGLPAPKFNAAKKLFLISLENILCSF